MLTHVGSSGSQTHFVGSLDSHASTTYTIDFFASAAADPSGHGEAQRYLKSITVTTDSAGHVAFDITLTTTTHAGEVVTATATDNLGNTSELAQNVTVTSGLAAERLPRALALLVGPASSQSQPAEEAVVGRVLSTPAMDQSVRAVHDRLFRRMAEELHRSALPAAASGHSWLDGDEWILEGLGRHG